MCLNKEEIKEKYPEATNSQIEFFLKGMKYGKENTTLTEIWEKMDYFDRKDFIEEHCDHYLDDYSCLANDSDVYDEFDLLNNSEQLLFITPKLTEFFPHEIARNLKSEFIKELYQEIC